MGDAAQRVLMNEFKQLSKEKWTNIEVSILDTSPGAVTKGCPGGGRQATEHPANHAIVDQRKRL